MKSPIHLYAALLLDVGALCATETSRDLETIQSRHEHEGDSFLTITLPQFCSDFERSLEQGYVDSTCFAGWAKRGCLPAFLRGFTSLVFDKTGRIRHEPSANAVYGVRQVCLVFKKVRLPCSNKREEAAFEKYKTNEVLLPNNLPENPRTSHFVDVAKFLWSNVFGIEFNTLDLVPRHGPGATAEKVSGNAKFSHSVWYERLDRCMPATHHAFVNESHMICEHDGLSKWSFVPESKELPVRVISVPKTLKGPRIIAIEPVCMQYSQQAISRWILDKVHHSPLTKSSIYFDDQSVHQRMAMRASSDRSLATLDLSDASDRVLLAGVRMMLTSQPELLAAIESCRTRVAQLPDGSKIPLKKFASMGSALTFPIEAMYFYTIIVHSLLWKRGFAPSWRRILNLTSQVYIFGDDLIVPVDEVDTVIEGLTFYECKVNSAKSFWNGEFRESCGCDAFRGVDVTPIYVREESPRNRRASAGIVSWTATSNLFHKAGCWRTANYMKSVVESVTGKLPVVQDTSPGLGWYSFCGLPSPTVLCRYYQVPLVRTYIVRAKKVKDPLSGYPALLKFFLSKRTEEAFFLPKPLQVDKKHLQKSARCGAVSRKRHWAPAY